jgi:glycosyltransferase involved in cell wall biosynthesis
MSTCEVIVPCYNYGRYLRSCVGSVLSQSGCDVRVLIIDDCSPDGSAAVAQAIAAEDRRVEVIAHGVNMGHIRTYNEGIDRVTAEYMLLLSADDLLAPGALARAIRLLEENPRVGFVYGRAIKFSDDAEAVAEPRGIKQSIWSGLDFIGEICARPECPVPTATAVVRTSVQRRIGGYRPELPHTGDFEMWLRFAANGDVGVLDAVQAFTRIHGGNMRNAYIADRMIGDYLQRYEALRTFFLGDWPALAGRGGLPALAYRRLAEDVLWDCARAFEEGAAEDADRLAQLARRIDPTIARSASWRKLTLKKAVGARAWRALAPLLTGARRLLSDRPASPAGARRLMNGIDTPGASWTPRNV